MQLDELSVVQALPRDGFAEVDRDKDSRSATDSLEMLSQKYHRQRVIWVVVAVSLTTSLWGM